MKSIIRTAGLLLGIVTLAGAVVAQTAATAERPGEAEPRFDPTQIVFKPGVGKVGLTLSVSGPGDFQLKQDYKPGVSPTFSVGDLVDGLYSYELRVAQAPNTDKSGGSVVGREEGSSSREGMFREKNKRPADVIVQSGHFRIEAGSLVLKGLVERGSEFPVSDLELTGQTGLPDKDVCYADDLIVDGSLCVGFDCTCNYSFGFDTIVLKENNLRIFFDDTSTAASFPRNDWKIVINDSANGGASYFGIEDSTAGRRTFSIEAGAPTHSLYVDDGGRVGLGTSTPSVELHMIDGDTPTLRLQQDGSSGFAPQTWDVAGNETNFFIRDVTTGSKLPFRIRPGAPTSSIFIDTDGDVGFGTASPERELHVYNSSDPANILVEGTGAGVILESTGAPANNRVAQIFVSSGGVLRMRGLNDAGGQNTVGIALDLSNGRVGVNTATPMGTLDVNGTIFLSSSQIHPDYVFDPTYQIESIEEHSALMWRNKHLPAVGPGAYQLDGRSVMEIGSKTFGILEELEKAHIYIDQLNTRLKTRDAELAEVTDRLERLEAELLSQKSGKRR